MTQNFERHDHHRHEGADGLSGHSGFHAQYHAMGHHGDFSAFKHDSAMINHHMHRLGILPGLDLIDHHHHHLHHSGTPGEHHHRLHGGTGHHEHQGYHGHLRHHEHRGHNGGEDNGAEDRSSRRSRGDDEGDLKKVSNDGNNMSKEEKEKYLYQRLTSKDGLGLTPKQAAGAIGSLEGESPDLFTGRVNHKHEHDLGFVNWIGTRRRELEHFAKEHGKDSTDFKTQVAFMEKELQGSEHKALSALKRASSVRDATNAFTSRYERPGIPHLQHRIKNAELAYERAKGHGWDESKAEDNQGLA